jgi:YVTN family beta-propeller protein
MTMAKPVTTVSDANEAAAGVALAEAAPPLRAVWLHALREMRAKVRRLHRQRIPQALTAADEEPLVETVAAPGFSVVGEIAVNNGPIGGMVFSPASDQLLVTNYGANSVSVIDPVTFAVVKTISGTDEPFVLAVGEANDCAYVSTASAAYDSISAIDTNTNTVVATYPVALSVRDLVVSPNGKRIYASRTGRDSADVAVIDTDTDCFTTIDFAPGAGMSAEALSISPDGLRLYVAAMDQSGGDLVVIDTGANRVVDIIKIGSPIRAVALSRDGDTAYVASCDPGSGGIIDVIDTRTNEITETVKIGGSPTHFTLSRQGGCAYVVDDDHVTVLCLATNEIGTITVGGQPSCVTDSRDGKQLYIADYAGGVTVLSVA